MDGIAEGLWKAIELILDSLDLRYVELGRKQLNLIMHDYQCKQLVCKGARLLQQITKDSGAKLTVAP